MVHVEHFLEDTAHAVESRYESVIEDAKTRSVRQVQRAVDSKLVHVRRMIEENTEADRLRDEKIAQGRRGQHVSKIDYMTDIAFSVVAVFACAAIALFVFKR